MDKSQIVRNLTTNILNDQNEGLFKLNMLFFYNLEDSILRNDQLNVFLKAFITSHGPLAVYQLFINANNSEEDMIFFQDFNKKVDAYIKCDIKTADLENTIFPFHSIFYRFFIKGGSALKVFVDNLESLGIIGEFGTIIPLVANAPTDIDSNIIVNPMFSEAVSLIIILKQIIQSECLKSINKYSSVYWHYNLNLIKKLQANDEFLANSSALFKTDAANIVISEPTRAEIDLPLPGKGFSVKPENACIRLSVLNPPSASISVFRILMCIDIYDIVMEIVEEADGTAFSNPVSNLLLNAEAELIDITVYELDNPKYADMWGWAKNAMPFDARPTLFQGIHQMMIDIIQMNDMAKSSRNPSLVAKQDKRQQRLDYLYFLYCNYLIIQNILENKNSIKEHHIIKYCHKLVEDEFIILGLTKTQINDILPYIIGKINVPFETIINDFLLHHILQDQSIHFEISKQSDRMMVSSKLENINAINYFPKRAIRIINDYVNTVIPTLSERNKALLLVDFVAILKESRGDGSALFVLISAILDACGVPPLQFTGTVRTTYKNMIKNIKLYYKQFFSSREYYHLITMKSMPIRNYVSVLLSENIGRLCLEIIHGITNIFVDVVILNKFAPFKVICVPKFEINLIELLEHLFGIIDKYLNRTDIPFIITYEMHPEFVINILFRFPFNKTIKGINVKGYVDLNFCRFILKYQTLPPNIHFIRRNVNNTLYQVL